MGDTLEAEARAVLNEGLAVAVVEFEVVSIVGDGGVRADDLEVLGAWGQGGRAYLMKSCRWR